MSRWLNVAVLAVLILSGAMGLKALTSHSNTSGTVWANTSMPMPQGGPGGLSVA
jgi:hypothetical protein